MRQRWRSLLVPVLVGSCAVGVLLGATLGAEMSQNEPSTGIGKTVYAERCAPCHGVAGKGDGPNAYFLDPKPRDFTTGTFKIRTTESGSIPTDDDIARSISLGLPGTGMPAWGKFLKGDTLKAVVAYVKSFSSRFNSDQPKAIRQPGPWSATPSGIAAGKIVYAKLQCGDCHGIDGEGTQAVSTEFEDDSGNRIRAANLTEPWTFHGGPTAVDIYTRFITGIDGTPMPAYVGSASDREMRDLADYVVSMGRRPIWQMRQAEVEALFKKEQSANGSDSLKRGEYLVNALGCAHCHSPLDSNGIYIAGMKYAGGQKWELGPYGTIVSYNLTSDTATGLGAWTDKQIKEVLTHGVRRDGSRMLPFPMPWTSLAEFTPDDLNAIVAYLRTIPPIQNAIPDRQPLGFLTYLSEKFKMLILKKELIGYVYAGNFGLSQGPEHETPAPGGEVKP